MSYIKTLSITLFLFSFKIWAVDCSDETFIALTIEISTGQNGSETAWQLFDTDTNELLAENSWFDNNSTETSIVCVPFQANLSFTIDCCINNEGYFNLLLEGISILSGNTYQDNQSFYFTATPTPNIDAELQHLNLPPHILTKPHILSGKIRNIGLQTINNISISWQINNAELHETAFLNINIASFDDFFFELEEKFYPTEEATQDIKIWLSAVNQSIDDNQNNDTIILQTNSFFSFSEQITLVENFTNASCSSCATIDEELTNLLQSQISKIAPISYHTPFPSFDSFYFENNTDVDTRLQHYQIAGVPAVYLAGTAVSGFFPVPTINQFENLHKTPSFISLTLQEKTNISNIDTTIHFSINIKPHIDIDNENLRLYIVLIEQEIEVNNIGSNGVNRFFYTMRKMLPHANGQVLSSMSKNETYDYKFTHKIANYLNFNELRTVIFIQDTVTKEVYQALLSNENTGHNQQSNLEYVGASFGQVNILRQSASCTSSQDGSIQLAVQGENPPFNFLWESGNTSAFRNNLSAGNYFVTISDFNETSQAFSIELSTSTSFEMAVTTTPTNLNEQSGTASVSLVNAQEPLLYEWSNGQTSPNIANLAAGNYVVSVTDAYGCMQSSNFTIAAISTSINDIKTAIDIKPHFFPNPTKNIVYLCTKQAFSTAPEVQVYDHLGRLQTCLRGEKKIDNHHFSYSIDELKNGYYFFNFVQNNQKFIHKLLIIN